MPGMNGVETLRLLRELDQKVPINIITAFHGEYIESLRELQNDHISFNLVKKPINLKEIVLITKSGLEGTVIYSLEK